EPRSDRIQLGLSRRRGHARLQPSGDLKPMSSSARHPAAEERVLDQGYPHLLTLGEKREAKRRRHDSDDRKRTLVQTDGASDDVGVCAKRTPPENLTEDDDGRRARVAVLGKKHTSRQRLRAEPREQLWRD